MQTLCAFIGTTYSLSYYTHALERAHAENTQGAGIFAQVGESRVVNSQSYFIKIAL